MRDLVVLTIVAIFFALCAAYVRWCDRIIGPDPELPDEVAPTDAPAQREELVHS